MATDYPNPYENTDYSDYQDPYMVHHNTGDSYNYNSFGQNGYSDTEYNSQDSYTTVDHYVHYEDSDHSSSRSGDQDDRDRYRTERPLDIYSLS